MARRERRCSCAEHPRLCLGPGEVEKQEPGGGVGHVGHAAGRAGGPMQVFVERKGLEWPDAFADQRSQSAERRGSIGAREPEREPPQPDGPDATVMILVRTVSKLVQ